MRFVRAAWSGMGRPFPSSLRRVVERNTPKNLSRREGLSAWNLERSPARNHWFHVIEAGEGSRQSEVKTM